jgi:hypothetical protein
MSKDKNPFAFVGQKVIIEILIPGHKLFKLEAPMAFTPEKVAGAIEEIMKQREESDEKPFDPIADNPELIKRDKRWAKHQEEMSRVFIP